MREFDIIKSKIIAYFNLPWPACKKLMAIPAIKKRAP